MALSTFFYRDNSCLCFPASLYATLGLFPSAINKEDMRGILQNLEASLIYFVRFSYLCDKSRRYSTFAVKNLEASFMFLARLLLSLQGFVRKF